MPGEPGGNVAGDSNWSREALCAAACAGIEHARLAEPALRQVFQNVERRTSGAWWPAPGSRSLPWRECAGRSVPVAPGRLLLSVVARTAEARRVAFESFPNGEAQSGRPSGSREGRLRHGERRRAYRRGHGLIRIYFLGTDRDSKIEPTVGERDALPCPFVDRATADHGGVYREFGSRSTDSASVLVLLQHSPGLGHDEDECHEVTRPRRAARRGRSCWPLQ